MPPLKFEALLDFHAQSLFAASAGLISIPEFHQRVSVLAWLVEETDQDPRDPDFPSADEPTPVDTPPDGAGPGEGGAPAAGGGRRPPPVHFLTRGLRKKWVFTIGDPDPHPSIPHGHFEDQNRPWPKLDPYRGHVFARMQIEDVSMRLTRDELIALWNDDKFRKHCHDQLEWFIERNPDWRFRVRNPLRLPRRRRK
jgi:hypothetical protein